MTDDLAASNVNRSYSLAASSTGIFTFMLFFLYPMFSSGEINALLFQITLIVMGVATFAFVFASTCYYRSSLGSARIDETLPTAHSRWADCFWLLGTALLFLVPSLILALINLYGASCAWFALWLIYVVSLIRHFPKTRAVGERLS